MTFWDLFFPRGPIGIKFYQRMNNQQILQDVRLVRPFFYAFPDREMYLAPPQSPFDFVSELNTLFRSNIERCHAYRQGSLILIRFNFKFQIK